MGQETSILNSELAVKILSAIASRTDGNYSTNLAEELDKSQPSISRILTELHNTGFIEKGKREKAQYYTVNYGRISEYWLQQIRKELKDENSPNLEKLDQNSEKLKNLAGSFFQNVLESANCSGMTVSCLIFDGFAYSIGNTIIMERENLLEENSFLEPVLEGLRLYTQGKVFSGDIYGSMDRSVEENLR